MGASTLRMVSDGDTGEPTIHVLRHDQVAGTLDDVALDPAFADDVCSLFYGLVRDVAVGAPALRDMWWLFAVLRRLYLKGPREMQSRFRAWLPRAVDCVTHDVAVRGVDPILEARLPPGCGDGHVDVLLEGVSRGGGPAYGFVVGTARLAYVHDLPERSIVFTADPHVNRPLAVYFPGSSLIVSSASRADALQFLADLLQYALLHWNHVHSVLSGDATVRPRVVTVHSQNHIGHLLYNCLSEYESQVGRRGGDPFHAHYFLKYAEASVYGPFAALTGIDAGRVTELPDLGHLPRCEDFGRFLPVVLGGTRLSASLIARIQRHATATHPALAAELESLRAEGYLLILVSLRFENRVWLNLTENILALLEHLGDTGAPILLILDGHNVVEGGTVRSRRETIEATCALRAREQGFHDDLAGRVPPRVRIFRNLDAPVTQSVLAAMHCDFFIAPWGAGLAKYKWAAGSSGIVASNRETLTDKPDRLIYQDPDIVAQIRPDSWVDASFVTDSDCQRDSIIPDDETTRVNFRVDPVGFLQAADVILAGRNASRTVSSPGA